MGKARCSIWDPAAITRSMSSGRQSGICAREEHSLEEILFIVCDRFDVAAQQAQDDILELIMQLEQAELLHSKRR
jgi:hypothetical protein